MKIPKCPKTVTGKHKFVDTSFMVCCRTSRMEFIIDNFSIINDGGPMEFGDIEGAIKCQYCGLVDDREEQK